MPDQKPSTKMPFPRSKRTKERLFTLSEIPPSDLFAPSERWWTPDGLDRLYVGDVIRIRQGATEVIGQNSDFEPVYDKTKTPAG